MSTTYNTEPPPSGFVTLHTTAGPIAISLFSKQTPLACRNFLQHALDGYYENTSFHRVVPGFVIQGGDPTGTGDGGSSIYEDKEFERDASTGEKVVFGDEQHSRLHFNRRGLVGMAKMTDALGKGSYGSQFFITLGDCRAELDGKCTMFGRVEGEGIYNVVKIAEAELVEGTERPMYPVRVTKVVVEEIPGGASWHGMQKREKQTVYSADQDRRDGGKKKASKKKGGKTLLSFAGEEGEDEDGAVVIKKAKFNTSLIDGDNETKPKVRAKGSEKAVEKKVSRRRQSASPSTEPVLRLPEHHRKPSLQDSTKQLPLRNPESPSASESPEPESKVSALSETNAQIAALKASMRREVAPVVEPKRKRSALEEMIPETSIRGRKRRHDGVLAETSQDTDALRILNAFKARLESADNSSQSSKPVYQSKSASQLSESTKTRTEEGSRKEEAADDEEATLCDLHFIANCQSCSNWSNNVDPNASNNSGLIGDANDDDDDTSWMNHALSFAKDRLGKDLTWRKKNEEELVVIDPREKERELKGGEWRKKRGDRGGGREWDREREKGRRER